jgi:hypothetical protein
MYCGVPRVAPACVSIPGSETADAGCIRGICQFGDAKVGEFHTALSVQENVRRFYVPVEHAFVMRVLEGLADFWHDGQCLCGCKPLCSHGLAQVHTIYKLHEQKEKAVSLAEVVDRDKVRMAGKPKRNAENTQLNLTPPVHHPVHTCTTQSTVEL